MPTFQLLDSGIHRNLGAGEERRGSGAPASSGSWRADLLLALPFLLFFWIQLAHHQLWQDEINAWGVAAASPDLKQLFHLLHYEAHPAIWYLLLWPVTRLTANPEAMKAVEAVVGAAVYLWIALKAPFSRLEKALVYLGYFVSFEYTVLSRMYGVMLLLALVYAFYRSTRPNHLVRLALLLALMANTDTMGALLSFSFILEYLFSSITGSDQVLHHSPKDWLKAAGIYLAGVAIAFYTLRPAPDITAINTSEMFRFAFNWPRFAHAALSYVVLPWFPISTQFPHHFWDPAVGDHKFLYLLLLPPLAATLYLLFRRDSNLLLLVVSSWVIGTLFGHLVYFGHMRHFGITFVAFLVAFWMQRRPNVTPTKLGYALLALSAAGGVLAAAAQWNHPFSMAAAEAGWIRRHGLQNEALVGAYDWSVVSVGELLERPIYFLDCSCTDRFLLLSNRRDTFEWDQIPDRMDLAFRQIDKPEVLLMTTIPLTGSDIRRLRQRSLETKLLASFPGGEVTWDGPFLYSVSRVAMQDLSPRPLR